MEEKQQSPISEEQIWEKVEQMGGFEKLAQEEEFFKCERDWWELPTAALESIENPSPEVKTALEFCMAVLEYSNGNFGYQPKDFHALRYSKNMRRVIKASLEARVRQKAKNALAGKASAEKRKNASAEESQHKTAQEYNPQQESAREDTSQHVLPQENTSQQESARANHTTITEQNRTETRTETEEELKERNKYKPTTTNNNSSSGKISLSISKAIEILEPWTIDSLDSAFKILKNDSRKEDLTREEKIAAVLYLLTGRTRSNISRITNLMDEAVSKGAKELDVFREVYYLALQASGQENDFEDKQQCRISTGSIVNRLRELVEEQSRRATQEQSPVEETQPSLATPQQQETEQPQQVAEQPQQETEQPKQAAEQPQQPQQPQQVTEQPQQAAEQPKPLRLAVVPQAKFSVERQSQLSLSVYETIDFITHNGCKTYRKAFTAIKEHGGNIDVQKTVVALYFLTGKSQPEVLEITGLVDKVVNEEAGKEEDVCKEVFKMATDTKDSNDCNFDDRNGCRAAIDRIKNYINKLLLEKYLKGPNKHF